MSASNTIAIYGAGGFGRETKFLLDIINRQTHQYTFSGFLDDYSDEEFARAQPGSYKNLAIAIAHPSVRQRIAERCGDKFNYPCLIHPGVCVDNSVNVKGGCVICAGVQLTVDISIGRFVIINLNATIGHDVIIEDFASIMPNASISGNVKIRKGAFIGSGAVILQGLEIGEGAVVGAGAVVTKHVPAGVIAKGVPARF